MGEEGGIGCEPALLGAGKTTSNPMVGSEEAVAEGKARRP